MRLSGSEAWDIALQLLAAPLTPQPGRVYLRKIMDGAQTLDKALFTFFKAPRSFTGEDIVEIAIHGSPYIKGRLLEILTHLGARPARGGEYSQRAYFNGKMDLVEAEALCDLIASDTASAHAAAQAGMDGKVSAKFNEIKDLLSELLAQIEVRLDDVDNEMEVLAQDKILQILESAERAAKILMSSYSTGKLVKEGIKVSIAGVPNAGKSSLLNAVLGYERAIVTEEAGTTRDTIEDAFDYKGHKIIITDTAGIREHAQGFAEQEGIARSMRAVEKADVILFVSDGSLPHDEKETALYKEILSHGKHVITVLNKADLPLKKTLKGIRVSAKNAEGVDALKEEIIKITGTLNAPNIMITSAIQYSALAKCLEELAAAKEAMAEGGEFLAEHVRSSLKAIKETIGEITPDDILGIIFSKFCVGK